MNHRLFGLRIGIAFAQADKSGIGVNAYPKPLNRAGVNGDSAGQMDGFDSRDLHRQSIASELPKKSTFLLTI